MYFDISLYNRDDNLPVDEGIPDLGLKHEMHE